MDMIMFYDMDHGPSTNHRPWFDRPEKGWAELNPWHPGAVQESGITMYRSTTPVLGLYDQRKPEPLRQHLYWMSALGCNVFTIDWTNYTGYSGYNEAQDVQALKYTEGLYGNTKVMLDTAKNITDFTPPKIYITVRMYGFDRKRLKGELDDVYKLYTEHKEQWYTFDDITENAEKPFLVIFADSNVLSEIAKGRIPYQDNRFNIRFSNGLLPSFQEESDGTRSIPGNNPTWLFVETEKDPAAGEGYYKVYHKDNDSGGVEQMSCWVSVCDMGRTNQWDAMNNMIGGKTTFERTLKDVKELKPQALLVNRFNYPVAWHAIPYEGISLYESGHIEPNKDFGFLVFNNVMENLYELNGWKKKAPDKPQVSQKDGRVTIPLDSFPLEYRTSQSSTMKDSEWVYLNINYWIVIPKDWAGSTVYLQTKNAFGESQIASFRYDK